MNGEIGVYEINEEMEKLDSLMERADQTVTLTQPRILQMGLTALGIKVISLSLIYIGQSIGRLVEEMRERRPS